MSPNPARRLEGMVALITGGARGNGLGVSRVFLELGAKVAMAGRTQEWGDQAVEELSAISPDVCFFRADVSDEAQVEACVEATVERFGSLQLVVNNAGATTEGITATKICETSLEKFRIAFSVNVDGPFLVCKYAIPHMLASGYGSIVNVSSNAAIRAGSSAAYASSKSAIHGLTLVLAEEYGPIVRCNEIVMGHVHPPNPDAMVYQFIEQDPVVRAALEENYMVGRWGSPEEFGYTCAFLCSPEAGFITASTVRLDGGSQSRMQFPWKAMSRFPSWLEERGGSC